MIPEGQLEIWSRRGADTGSRDTNLSIRTALSEQLAVPNDARYEIHLQGSYRNATNIRGDSDVDVVIELTNPLFLDKQNLSDAGAAALDPLYGMVDYDWSRFRADVEAALRRYYGSSAVTSGKKVA